MTEPENDFGANQVEDGFAGGTNRQPPLPGVREISQDPDLFAADDDITPGENVRAAVQAALALGTANDMVKAMSGWLGTTEHPPGSNHNQITVRYNKEVDQIGDGPWCDMTVTISGIDSDTSPVVGKFAYTPSHAAWFNKQGAWHYGTSGIRRGAVVFYDWSGSRSIGNIDHVGVVEHVNGDGTFTVIEGNHNDRCERVVRNSTYVVGYGMPAYSAPRLVAPTGKPYLQVGSSGGRVEMLQRCLNKLLKLHLVLDGDFGPLTRKAVIAFQIKSKFKKAEQDGVYGPQTQGALAKALKGVA